MITSFSIVWDHSRGILRHNTDEVPLFRRLQAPAVVVTKTHHDDFVKGFCHDWSVDECEESPIHLFVFCNSMCGKALNVYQWALITTTDDKKNYCVAFLFEVVDAA